MTKKINPDVITQTLYARDIARQRHKYSPYPYIAWHTINPYQGYYARLTVNTLRQAMRQADMFIHLYSKRDSLGRNLNHQQAERLCTLLDACANDYYATNAWQPFVLDGGVLNVI